MCGGGGHAVMVVVVMVGGGAPMKRLVMRWRCLRGACAYLFMCVFLFEEFF